VLKRSLVRLLLCIGMELGRGQGDFVLDGDHAPLPKRGRSPPPIFGPCLLRPNGWMNEGGTWHGGRPQSLPPQKKRGAEPLSPIFCPFLLWPLAKRFDTSRCHLGVGLSSGDFVLDGVPVFPPNKGGGAPLPIFGHSYCAQTAGCIKMPLGMEVGLSPGEFVLDGDPAPSPKGGRSPLPNF